MDNSKIKMPVSEKPYLKKKITERKETSFCTSLHFAHFPLHFRAAANEPDWADRIIDRGTFVTKFSLTRQARTPLLLLHPDYSSVLYSKTRAAWVEVYGERISSTSRFMKLFVIVQRNFAILIQKSAAVLNATPSIRPSWFVQHRHLRRKIELYANSQLATVAPGQNWG